MKVVLTGTDPCDPRGGIGVAMGGFRAALESVGLLEELVPSFRPHSLGGRTILALRAVPAMARAVRRVQLRGEDVVVYGHGGAGVGLVRQAVLLWIAQRLGAATMLQLHALEINEYVRTYSGRAFLRTACQSADVVCVLTPWWKRRVARAEISSTFTVIPDPLSSELVEAASTPHGRHDTGSVEVSRTSGSVEVLTMSRVVAGKGIDVVLRALALLPAAFSLTVAGEGPQEDEYRRLAEQLCLGERVRFLGWVSGDRKRALLTRSDIFCLPTTMDSFCMGFIEAMAFGLPIVAVDWGPISDVVRPGETGILAARAAPRDVADGLLSLTKPSLRAQFGSAGQRWVLDHLSPERVGPLLKGTADLACRIAHGRSGRRAKAHDA